MSSDAASPELAAFGAASFDAVVLAAHGSVDALEDLPAFLTNIRHGHAPSAELLRETRRRYEVIGGASPLNTINRALACALEGRLGVPVRLANRLFAPLPGAVLAELATLGARRVAVVPLAPHSTHIYADGFAQAVASPELERFQLTCVCAPNWARSPELTAAFASNIASAVASDEPSEPVAIVFSAHSLPVSVVRAGDPYEDEYRASVALVFDEVQRRLPGARLEAVVAFQSQGMSLGAGGRPIAWLGPDLRAALESVRARGLRRVVIAPIGFLADHVEILYDLDIEAKVIAEELGLVYRRAPLLNAETSLVDILEILVRSLGAISRTR